MRRFVVVAAVVQRLIFLFLAIYSEEVKSILVLALSQDLVIVDPVLGRG